MGRGPPSAASRSRGHRRAAGLACDHHCRSGTSSRFGLLALRSDTPMRTGQHAPPVRCGSAAVSLVINSPGLREQWAGVHYGFRHVRDRGVGQASEGSRAEVLRGSAIRRNIFVRAVVFKGAFDVAVENVADPGIEKPLDAVVRVTTANICGSDLHPYEGRAPLDAGMVLGHENMGVVEATGLGWSGADLGGRPGVGSVQRRHGPISTCSSCPPGPSMTATSPCCRTSSRPATTAPSWPRLSRGTRWRSSAPARLG
jgi:Alcohol dehydrogenase GroES-like domain/Alcohol dehydrogenase GroES-associated